MENLPELPRELAYLWECFKELCSKEPLTYSEIKAYIDTTGFPLHGWQVDAIKSIDRLFHKRLHEK